MLLNTIFKSSSIKDIFWLYKIISKKSKVKLFKLIILMICCAIAEVISITAVVPFLALLINSNQISEFKIIEYLMGLLKISNPILIAGLILIVTNIFTPFLRLYNLKKGGLITAEIGSELSYMLYKVNLNQQYSEYIKSNSGSLISAANLDIGRVVLILSSINNIITGFFISLFIISNLIFVNSKIAISSIFIFGGCYVFISFLTKKKLSRNSKIVAECSVRQVNLIQEIFGSIREVLLYQYQDIYLQDYIKVDKPMRKLGAENIFLASFPKFILESTGLILITLIAIIFTSNDQNVDSILPILGIFAISAQRILPSFQQIYVGWANIRGNQANLQRVKLLINKKTLKFRELRKIKQLEFKEKIIFKNVYFKHNDNNNIFFNLNFHINKGEKIGLVGNTGAGKSTLVNLIMGFLYPQKGEILVDNFLISDPSKTDLLRKWQKNISYVPQNIYLKDGTFIENIAFGIKSENINFDKVLEVSKKAQIKNFIDQTEKGLFSKVGERGVLLSGGQAQRIAISRALYRNSNVLILDEATSALDNFTEKQIINSIFNLDPSLTLIMISHRLSTLRYCDRIFHIQNSKLEEVTYEDISKIMDKFL